MNITDRSDHALVDVLNGAFSTITPTQARDELDRRGRHAAVAAGFTQWYGPLHRAHGTVRTTNGGEVTGDLTTQGATYHMQVTRADGTGFTLPARRIAGVRVP
jgi:hypothetical protein